MNENEINEEFEAVEVESTEEVVEETVQEEEKEDVDVEALRKENETLKAQKDHWKTKAAKIAESTPEKVDSKLSPTDMYILMENKVPAEDIPDIEDYAKLKNLSIQEAMTTPMVKTLLREKEEERKVALATHSGNAKRTTQDLSDDVILSKASENKLPEKDADIAKLVKARMNRFKNK